MKAIILAIIGTILIFTSNPTLILLGIAIFGYMLSRRTVPEALLSAPAFGIVATTLILLATSRIGIDVEPSRIVIATLTIILGLKTEIKLKLEEGKLKELGLLGIASFLGLVVRNFYFLLPDYRAADTWFHGSKVKMIISTGTVYFTHVPEYFSRQIITYPPGYHALVALLSGFKTENIIYAMNTLRIFEILYLPVLAYLVGKNIKREVGIFAAFLVNFSALYYYFVQYALLPAFTNYMLFLFALYILQLSIRERKPDIILLLGLTSGVMVVTHPYQYMLFQAVAFFTTISLENKREGLKIFLAQLIVSGAIFLAFTPSSSTYLSRGVSMNPRFSNKDNPDFLISIIKYSFIENGQLLFGFTFVLGLIVSIIRGSSIERGIALGFLTIISLMLNKTYIGITIPYFSAIWNSERAFMLTTPIIPLLEGIGMERVARIKKEVAISLLIIGMIISYPHLRIEHIGSESSYLLDKEIVDFIMNVSKIAGNETVMTACEFDSGRWIPILTNTPIACYPKNISKVKYLYVDTRGAGEIEVYLINIVNFLDRKVIMFRDGLWLLRLDEHGSPPRDVLEYYHTNGTIRPLDDTRWFVYGYINQNPVIIKLRKFEKFPYALMISSSSSVLFSTSETFNELIITINGRENKTVEIYLDGKLLRRYKFKNNYRDEKVNLKVTVPPGLHYLTFYSPNTSYRDPIGIKEIALKR
ncbi:integral membrane glycosyltransferase [Pyrococcus furiosus COM1]|uniref:Integral membrane glycosyltransferase n=1 Tax=Pyrococcus furiosus COM1 TaxID=1185654 RepID=I6TVF2_9EURY|nr:DUF6541 family protein [Pyrococcus furiosus]AFN03304.1 integral membrane glycosyltransferase [Pyrococcus furiosus COM1]